MRYILSLFLVLALSSVANANTFGTKLGGPAQEIASSTACPSWADDAILAWDGDHSSGSNYLCTDSSTAVAGTATDFDTSTSYGDDGVGVRLTDRDQNLVISNSSYVSDLEGPHTLWMRVRFHGIPDSATTLLELYINSSERVILLAVNSSSSIKAYGSYVASGSSQTAYTQSITEDTYYDIAYSWDQSIEDHSAYHTQWDEDAGELTTAITGNPSNISIGENVNGAEGIGTNEYIDIDKFALVSGYETSVPW